MAWVPGGFKLIHWDHPVCENTGAWFFLLGDADIGSGHQWIRVEHRHRVPGFLLVGLRPSPWCTVCAFLFPKDSSLRDLQCCFVSDHVTAVWDAVFCLSFHISCAGQHQMGLLSVPHTSFLTVLAVCGKDTFVKTKISLEPVEYECC